MKITGFEYEPISMQWKPPYARPGAASYYRPAQQEGLLVTVVTDEGVRGVGEATPVLGVFGENCAGVRATLGVLERHLVGQDALAIGAIHAIMDRIIRRGNITAKYAIDVALHDIKGQALGLPVFSLLGGPTRERALSHFSVAANTPEEMAHDCAEAANAGYRYLKVKVAGTALHDLDGIVSALEVVGEDVTLTIDVNEAWSVPDTLRVARELERLPGYKENIILEQPIRGSDLDGLAYIKASTAIPVLADEAAWTVEDVMEVVRRRAADMVSIKVVETGGLYRAMQAASIAEAANVPYVIDEACETRIANTAVAHVAMAVGEGMRYTGTTNHLHFENDVNYTGGVQLEGGYAVLGSDPGLGLHVLPRNPA